MSVERWGPIAIALLSGLAQFLWGPPGLVRNENLLMFIGGLGAIAIGFTGTALAIIIAIEDRPVVRWLKAARLEGSEEDGYSLLLRYMMAALRWWFAALLLAASGFLLGEIDGPPEPPRVVTACLAAVSLGGMAAWYRVSRLTVRLLRTDRKLSEHKVHAEDQPVPQRRSAAG